MNVRKAISDRLRRRWQWLHSRDAITFLLFVVVATAIWYGHALVSMRNGKVQVPVYYTGIDGTIALSDSLPKHLEIEVRDAGNRLRLYRHNPPVLSFDLSDQVRAKQGEIRISAEVIRRSLSDQLQGTTRLQHVRPESIHTTYYKQHRKRVAVRVAGSVSPQSQYQIVGGIRAVPDSVTLYGRKQMLDTIRSVRTESLALSGITDTVRAEVGIVLPAGVRADRKTLTVEAVAEQFTEKEIEVALHAAGVPAGERLHLFPNRVHVVARVGLSHFAEVSAADFRAYCTYPKQQDVKGLPVEIQCSNPHVTLVRTNPNTVEFLIEQ